MCSGSGSVELWSISTALLICSFVTCCFCFFCLFCFLHTSLLLTPDFASPTQLLAKPTIEAYPLCKITPATDDTAARVEELRQEEVDSYLEDLEQALSDFQAQVSAAYEAKTQSEVDMGALAEMRSQVDELCAHLSEKGLLPNELKSKVERARRDMRGVAASVRHLKK